MRTEILLLLCAASGLAGCATPAPVAAGGTASGTCVAGGNENPAACGFPPDVRAFIEDRALCDHFRGEPWPEDDGADSRERRLEIVAGVRSACTGTDDRLQALKSRYRDDPAVMQAISGYDGKAVP